MSYRKNNRSRLIVTRNEILYFLYMPEDFILAMIEFRAGESVWVYYMRRLFNREPDFGVTSVNCNFAVLLVRANEPS